MMENWKFAARTSGEVALRIASRPHRDRLVTAYRLPRRVTSGSRAAGSDAWAQHHGLATGCVTSVSKKKKNTPKVDLLFRPKESPFCTHAGHQQGRAAEPPLSPTTNTSFKQRSNRVALLHAFEGRVGDSLHPFALNRNLVCIAHAI